MASQMIAGVGRGILGRRLGSHFVPWSKRSLGTSSEGQTGEGSCVERESDRARIHECPGSFSEKEG